MLAKLRRCMPPAPQQQRACSRHLSFSFVCLMTVRNSRQPYILSTRCQQLQGCQHAPTTTAASSRMPATAPTVAPTMAPVFDAFEGCRLTPVPLNGRPSFGPL